MQDIIVTIKKNKMKILNIIIPIMIACSGYAQQTKLKYEKIQPVFKEIQGKHNTYIKELYPHAYNLYNKNSNLRGTQSDYMLYDINNTAWEYIKINDKNLLNSFMKTYIAPSIKKNKREYKFSEVVSVQIYADMKGNILEIGLHCPKDIFLPVAVFEEFEQAVLNSDLKLCSETENSLFRNSTWVYQSIPFDPDSIRNMN